MNEIYNYLQKLYQNYKINAAYCSNMLVPMYMQKSFKITYSIQIIVTICIKCIKLDMHIYVAIGAKSNDNPASLQNVENVASFCKIK